MWVILFGCPSITWVTDYHKLKIRLSLLQTSDEAGQVSGPDWFMTGVVEFVNWVGFISPEKCSRYNILFNEYHITVLYQNELFVRVNWYFIMYYPCKIKMSLCIDQNGIYLLILQKLITREYSHISMDVSDLKITIFSVSLIFWNSALCGYSRCTDLTYIHTLNGYVS